MKLSNQSIGTLMMCLQKSLMSQTDIVPMLQELNFACDNNNSLNVLNPPVVSMDDLSGDLEDHE